MYPEMIRETYDSYNDGKKPEDVGDFKPIEMTDKFGIWKSDDKREIVISVRGISLNNAEDFKTLTTEIIPNYSGGLRGGELSRDERLRSATNFGSNMNEDYKDLEEALRRLETEYEDYYVKVAGHSRGGV